MWVWAGSNDNVRKWGLGPVVVKSRQKGAVGWYPPGVCLWSDSTQHNAARIPDRISTAEPDAVTGLGIDDAAGGRPLVGRLGGADRA